ncbi:hypothetical protein K1W69_13765 [Hoeflea sp. WL0058]|uniref:Transmembrane protein n=1 Tax=Flavimaribacter sediminis TaxID=2865987 RepID=A0AAE3D276_9HYPH|nr:hypothetical protein [Flavimaribacter sediminis]MBW8638258.1 hypothetical protein [Flavimaribacter sediminis]
MTEGVTQNRNVSLSGYLKRFLLIFTAVSIAFVSAAFLLRQTVLVLPMWQSVIAGGAMGHYFAQWERRRPQPRESWRLCFRFVLVGYPVAAILIILYASDFTISGFLRHYDFYAERGELLIMSAMMFFFSLWVAFFNIIFMWIAMLVVGYIAEDAVKTSPS